MPSESKPLLTAQTEKPNHYKYLKEFRVEQCPSFLQHKCTQHRPFTCFHWHFNNQRRRRPVRKRDGTFNYSADNYCTKYNETSGICEDGDECPYLHRTAGDTERRYHLRYYKTCMCVHDTDARGLCTKNGAHCAFAHGAPDLRPPVLDMRELQALENPDGTDGDAAAPNALDRERNLMNEDPKWQDTNYVLSSYKTEPCKRPPRLCRQGYACPQYHNSKDKRRSPRKYKYRSTPCPNVKHGEEWGEPSNCEAGDACGYCHTRTEQQFHPEIYKSTKCNDVQQAGYCPRGLFCAFAHVEPDDPRDPRDPHAPHTPASLADLLSAALPPPAPPLHHANGSGDGSECASTSSGGSARAPAPAPPEPPAAPWAAAAFDATVLQEVVGNALDDLHLDDPRSLVAALDRDLADAASAPVAIPGSPLPPFLRYADERLYAHSLPPPPRADAGELARLRDEVAAARAAAARWDERIAQARAACEAWQREADDAQRKAARAERQRDEAAAHARALQRELEAARRDARDARDVRDVRGLPLAALKALQAQARAELEEIEKVLYAETAAKCMVCEEQPRAVTLAPCNHYVACDACAAAATECPYCQTPLQ
uniref:RING finger protein unkempt-like protein n=1 Tax=Heliconius erato TaxID=33431 RepID=L7X0P5_HELEA|nr:RING finger protein unkempt-like protein [Heliconius erato]